MLKKIVILNYRLFQHFQLELTPGMNILVGDNDIGKSTLLEAVNLCLTGRVQSRQLAQDLSPYIFNMEATRQYVKDLQEGRGSQPPEMFIELYLEQTEASAPLKGNNNSTGEDTYGLRFRALYNPEYNLEYEAFIKNPADIRVIPSEYYRCEWLGFDGNPMTPRRVPASVH